MRNDLSEAYAPAATERTATVCPDCGSGQNATAQFCDRCGAKLSDGARVSEWGSDAAANEPGGSDEPLSWTYDIPLINNRFIVWDWLCAVLVTLVIVIVAILGIVVFDESVELTDLAGTDVVLAIAFGALALASLIAALVMGNHVSAEFTLASHGVTFQTGHRERTMMRLAVVLGVLSGRPGMVGAGAFAVSREREHHPWGEVRKVTVHPGPRVISLSNSWRVFMRLYCPPELFDEVVRRVRANASHAVQA
jgi:hypothetical protein